MNASFWLLDAPDSLVRQSSTHPFLMDNRLMAQNRAFGDLALIEDRLGAYRHLVRGDTDSERFFALVTREIDEHDGQVGEGIAAAARWVADTLPMQSLNAIVIADGHLWALRYPDQRALHVLKTVGVAATTSRMRVAVEQTAVVVVASERLDHDLGRRMLEGGELLHVRPDLTVESSLVLTRPHSSSPSRRVTPCPEPVVTSRTATRRSRRPAVIDCEVDHHENRAKAANRARNLAVDQGPGRRELVDPRSTSAWADPVSDLRLFAEAVRAGAEVYARLKARLSKDGYATGLGDEESSFVEPGHSRRSSLGVD